MLWLAINPFYTTSIFCTPWKHWKASGFLMFSGRIERDQWHEMGKFNFMVEWTGFAFFIFFLFMIFYVLLITQSDRVAGQNMWRWHPSQFRTKASFCCFAKSQKTLWKPLKGLPNSYLVFEKITGLWEKIIYMEGARLYEFLAGTQKTWGTNNFQNLVEKFTQPSICKAMITLITYVTDHRGNLYVWH